MLLIYDIVYPHNFGKLSIFAKPFNFIQNMPEYHIASNRQKSNKEQVSENKDNLRLSWAISVNCKSLTVYLL